MLDPGDADFGFRHLKAVAQGQAADGAWEAHWTAPASVLSLRAVEPSATTVLHASGPGVATTGERIPFLLARRVGVRSARFTTLIETRSRSEESAVTGVRRVADGHVRVDLAGDRRDDLLVDGEGYALVRRQGSSSAPVSVDLLHRSAVTVDGREWIKITDGAKPKVLENVSAVYDGGGLRLSVHRTADRTRAGAATAPGPVTMSVYAPGITSVHLNGKPADSVSRRGDVITVTFTIA
ncbi:hypothetical protein [Nocardia aurea]|uniref:hypothetical protein n=1 Tax=Nocardia aurea TaxID=2144174 RepID=UPI000D69A06E|nr:hypothetical protein [Nocardia aurea]